jgi:beta-xylosidase
MSGSKRALGAGSARLISRREGLGLLLAATTLPTAASAQGSAAASSLDPYESMHWGKGFDGQRRSDLGNGKYLNPIFAGDHPDPALLRDGDDYYLTFSSFDSYPGVIIWHSRDLVNWLPVTAALSAPLGSVWAPCLTRNAGTFHCYIPARSAQRRSIHVITAARIQGPWSSPVDLGLTEHIDPDHVVDEAGRRWLYLSGGDRVPLAEDGLRTAGSVEHVYDPWRYPESWVTESFSPEGPKLVKRGDWWYMITAVGGTAGPPTGHMVIAARSRRLQGPWENCPRNPLIRTRSAREKWWSRGHATLFEGPQGRWWMMYHGYENGYWTLGRQTLLEPVRWTRDGWPQPIGGDLSKPLIKPRELAAQAHGAGLSDDFTQNRLGVQWSFYDPAPGESARLIRRDGVLQIAARGTSPADCSPLTCIAGDHAYRVTVDLEIDDAAEGGMLLFYNRRLFAGLGLNANGLAMHRYGLSRAFARPEGVGRTIRLRLRNDRNILTMHTSIDAGAGWRQFPVQMEVSGYHHNVAYDFLSLRPALYAAGEGSVRFRNFMYEALA